jgi:hypothetical protein
MVFESFYLTKTTGVSRENTSCFFTDTLGVSPKFHEAVRVSRHDVNNSSAIIELDTTLSITALG